MKIWVMSAERYKLKEMLGGNASNRKENVLLVDLMQLRKESVSLKMGQKKLPKLEHIVKKEHSIQELWAVRPQEMV